MRNFKGAFVTSLVVAGALTATWNIVLSERARENVRGAFQQTKRLVDHLLNCYLGQNQASNVSEAVRNRAWVEEQWRQAGF